MFSEYAIAAAEDKFIGLLEHVGGEKKREILAHFSRLADTCSEDIVFATKWLYANSPLSDWANYDFELFHACAAHGVFLRTHSIYAKDMPEELFLNYVLHCRINEEELCDCRRFFYEQLHERIAGMSCHDAILEINYWNAENMTYQSTDLRTISALGAYHSASGRCGEESSFAVNVFRALGIAARQIYTPRWAHCDDNHAWVEVWVDGEWHFLGACEPEEVLNKAWFTNAAGRAPLIHSRCFGEISSEELICKKGMVSFLNHLSRYAQAKSIRVRIIDAQGAPIPGAEVSFGVLNYSEIHSVAEIITDQNGEAALTCGHGSLFVRARGNGVSCERLIVPDTDTFEIVLCNEETPCDVWKDVIVTAPRDGIASGNPLTEAQKLKGAQKTAFAGEKRTARVKNMFDEQRVQRVIARYGYDPSIHALLHDSLGNFERLLAFLEDEAYGAHEKEMLLNTLSAKDRRDVDPEILREALDLAREESREDEAFLYSYILCPRIYYEPLSKYRRFILAYFSDEEKEQFKARPQRIWAYILQNIGFDASLHYDQIVTTPVGALTVKNASPLSKSILFVAICRSLGIAARMNHMNRRPEYYESGTFVSLEQDEKRSCTLHLVREGDENWQYGTDFSFARLIDGIYQTYEPLDKTWDSDTLAFAVEPGDYRVITDNRLPNGDIHASMYHLRLEDGEAKSVKLRKFPASTEDMLGSYALEDFKLFAENGQPVWGSALTQNKAVLLWLEEGKEPTEHILNEMLEEAENFKALPANIIFILRGKEALENAKLRSVLERFPAIQIYYDSFLPNVETLARRLYVDPEKLPLIAVTDSPLNAVYASSGYNVGCGNMIIRMCRSLQEKGGTS